MRDILFTIASAGPHPAPLRVRTGAAESFIDAGGQVAVQFSRAEDQVVACVLVSRDERVDATLVVGPAVPALLATLRHATDGDAGPQASS